MHRAKYYSQLGVQAVEVKPSLDNALEGEVLNVDRLNKLCLWVRIPHYYRPMVWKVLLGVVPLVKEAWPDTWGQQGRTGCFNDLKRWKNVLFDGRLKQQQQHQAERGEDKDVRLNSGSSRDHEAADSAAGEGEGVGQELDLTATALDLVKMYLIYSFDLTSQTTPSMNVLFDQTYLPNLDCLRALAACFLEICDYNELDAFWIFALFVKPRHKDIIKELFSILLPTQQEQSTPSPHPSLPAPTIPPSKTILPLPTSTSSSSLSSSSSSSTLSTSLLIIESLQDPLQSTSSISQLLPSPLPPTAIRISFIIRDIGQFDALLLQHSPPTHSHMKNVIGISDFTTVSVFRNWFASFFAIVMSSYTLEGIWDIYIGGATNILPYVALSLILACKRKIEASSTYPDFLAVLEKIAGYVDMDAVASTSINLWEKPVLETMPREDRVFLGV